MERIEIERACERLSIAYARHLDFREDDAFAEHLGDESLADDPIAFAGPAAVGHYEDEFLRTAAGWRIGRRVLRLAFRRADAFPRA